MSAHDHDETPPMADLFDFSEFPEDTFFHERRVGHDRRRNLDRGPGRSNFGAGRSHPTPGERRVKKERRRRIDPTTFEKQYTKDEIEFMNAMQRFKIQSGKTFPTYGEVLRVARALGYKKVPPLTPPAEFSPPQLLRGSSDDSHDVPMALAPE